MGIPPVPSYFTPRPRDAEAIRSLLRPGADDGAAVTIVGALHGMGGVGKTTLLAKLARELDDEQAFPDGIRWVTLGEEPTDEDLRSWLGTLATYFGDPQVPAGSITERSERLRHVLAEKEGLIVLDDAWKAEHVRPFLVGGPRCRVVITTRDVGLARVVGAIGHDLDVMSPDEARGLIARRLGRPWKPDEREQADAVAREVGYLPLALEQAAAQVAEGDISWAELLDDLRREIARLRSLEPPDVDEHDEATRRKLSPRASFHVSLRRLPRGRRDQFLWLGVLQEEVSLAEGMVRILWGVDQRDARDALRYLRDKGLLMPGLRAGDGPPTFRLHDLLREYALSVLTAPVEPRREGDPPGLGLTLVEAHQTYLDRHRAAARAAGEPQPPWHALPDDGYLHDHLVWHLEKAGRTEGIHALFEAEEAGQNAWFRARETRGAIAGYIADLDRAWAIADQALQASTLPAPVSMARQIRYALILSSLTSVASILPGTLYAQLVEAGLWSTEQALAYAQRIPILAARVHVLLELYPALEGNRARQLLADIIELVCGMKSKLERTRNLAALAPHLGPDQHADALELTRGMVDEEEWAEVLAALAPHLGPGQRTATLAEVRGLEDTEERAHALAALAPHLDPGQRAAALAEALDLARGLQYEANRARALAALAPHLDPGQHTAILAEALEEARNDPGEWERARALAELAPHLGPDLLADALESARGLRHKQVRAEVLAALAPHLDPGQRTATLADALEEARGLEDEANRAHALAALAPYLDPGQHADTWEFESSEWDEALAALAPHLGPDQHADALKLVCRLANERERVGGLNTSAPHLARHQTDQILHLWTASIHTLVNERRYSAFSSLSWSGPLLVLVGGPDGVRGVAQAIRDVGRWWP